ncbi:aromatic acid exporter family protein [Streptococcus sp. HF-1907]|uniref:aromatic acid exporter family protein n=1 Tax=Streptococcus sp. HF-1907 TaxID=2785793 RepID=UPI0018A02E94|nr:aromatic acid exporter family protein [Streptococcus sp. HF-1907]MBF7093771.1 aromatic acid exporter family protein [Streptococcus sp. HF-1907]
MSILQRSIKMILSTVLATSLAQQLGLSYATAAGVIAILSVLDTRRSTLEMTYHRFLSALLALAIAYIAFQSLGFNLLAFTCYLVFYIPLALGWELAAGIAPSTVLVTHLWVERTISLAFMGHELALFILGAGVALLANLYMPSHNKRVQSYHQQSEKLLKSILLKFNQFLLDGGGRNEASLINELDSLLEEALALVYRDRHNQVFKQTNYEAHYFEMRQQQNQVLRLTAHNMNHCQLASDEGEILAELFGQTAEQLSQENPATALLTTINQCLSDFRQRELPKTREEFENCARLFQNLHDLEHFLQLKVTFYQCYMTNNQGELNE